MERRMESRVLALFVISAQIVLLRPSIAFGQAAGALPTYNYDLGSPFGPDKWGTLSPLWQLCKDGKEQSPIAIDIPHTVINESLGSLQYMYSTSNGVLINNGHTVQLTFMAGAGSLVIGSDIYSLKQLHFHTPSEHVINNVRLPLEMHLVHATSDGKKIAVIGVVFRKSHGGQFLDQFPESLQYITQKGSNVSFGPLSFEKLHMGRNYVRYQGSLTTPPCSQNVTWTVELSQRNTVSQSQLDALKTVISEPNARPLQQNIRTVERFLEK